MAQGDIVAIDATKIGEPVGTKNNPGNYDCYENAHPDEPMFTLLARDHRAPGLVRQWAQTHRAERIAAWEAKDKNAQEAAEYPYGLDEKEEEAMRCATEMEIWRNDRDGELERIERGG